MKITQKESPQGYIKKKKKGKQSGSYKREKVGRRRMEIQERKQRYSWLCFAQLQQITCTYSVL